MLFAGDYLSSQKKKDYLIDSAEQLITQNHATLDMLGEYRFEKAYIDGLNAKISLISDLSQGTQMTVIVPDRINGTPVYLGFSAERYRYRDAAAEAAEATMKAAMEASGDVIRYEAPSTDGGTVTYYLKKQDYLYRADVSQKAYLDKAFADNSTEISFSAFDGTYEMFYPYQVNGKTVAVLYFSDYQNYGKFGS